MDAPPPPQPPRLAAWLAALLALVVIGAGIAEIAADTARERPGVHLDTGDGDADALDADAIAADLGAHLPHDPQGFRSALAEHRLAINLVAARQIAETRTAWATPVARALELASLASLLLLGGPLLVARRLPPGPERRRRAWWTVPWFTATAAALMALVRFVGRTVIDLQVVQITIASFGALPVALGDATMHFLVHPGLLGEDDAALLAQYEALPATAEQDPFAALALFDHLFAGYAQARDSSLLAAVPRAFESLGWLLELYGPLVALLTAVVVVRVLAPLVASLVRYPLRRAAGEPVETLGRFSWQQLGRIWSEVRIALWLFLFMALLMVLAVVMVRAVGFAVVAIALRTLLASDRGLAATGELADVAVFCSGLSLAVMVSVVAASCLLPAGIALGKAHWVLRARSSERRAFRAFPAFWRLLRRLGLRVTGAALLATLAALALYAALGALGDSPALAVWLPAVVLAPVQLALVVWLGVPRQALAALRTDVLAR